MILFQHLASKVVGHMNVYMYTIYIVHDLNGIEFNQKVYSDRSIVMNHMCVCLQYSVFLFENQFRCPLFFDDLHGKLRYNEIRMICFILSLLR